MSTRSNWKRLFMNAFAVKAKTTLKNKENQTNHICVTTQASEILAMSLSKPPKRPFLTTLYYVHCSPFTKKLLKHTLINSVRTSFPEKIQKSLRRSSCSHKTCKLSFKNIFKTTMALNTSTKLSAPK